MRAVTLALSVLALAHPGAMAALGDDWQGWQLSVDNDLLAGHHEDRWYTSGVRFSWTYKEGSAENDATAMARSAAQRANPLKARLTLTRTIGQTIYTPRFVTTTGPQVNDRPWAAFLYGGITAHAIEGRNFAATDLKLGVVGPAALGRQAQSLIHDIIGVDRPAGWAHQLKPRPGVQISHLRLHRFDDRGGRDIFGFQVGAGGAVGSLRSHANLNASMTIGRLDGDTAPLMIANEGDFVVQDFRNQAQYRNAFGFVGISLTKVVHNHFLTGSTATYGRSKIDPRHGYAMLQWGLSLPTHRWARERGFGFPRLVYAYTVRSPEFDSPAIGRREAVQRWGTLTANWDFD